MDVLRKFGYFFYIMNPSEHVYVKLEDIRNYYAEIAPCVYIIIMVSVVKYASEKNSKAQRDIVMRTGSFFIQQTTNFLFEGTAFMFYLWIYENFRVVTLPWNSVWVWFFGLIATDLWTYCFHRMSHEISLLWAIHETHHIPESMDISTASSLHFLQTIVILLTPNPLALFLPPTIYMVHFQLNLIFQLHIHTEVIGKLPNVIEFFFNTASHHRVHHARNRIYIDKNYGAVLIIWDRMFGTFQEEDPNEKPIYGTTIHMKSYNHLVVQSRYFCILWRKFWRMKGFRNKFFAIFKGPGWSPGKPWTGDREDIAHPPPRFEHPSWDAPQWLRLYWFVHGTIVATDFPCFAVYLPVLSKVTIGIAFSFISFSEIVFGFALDGSQYAVPLEVLRILLYFVLENAVYPELSKHGLVKFACTIHRTLFCLSLLMWFVVAVDRTAQKIGERRTKNLPIKSQFQSFLFSYTPGIMLHYLLNEKRLK